MSSVSSIIHGFQRPNLDLNTFSSAVMQLSVGVWDPIASEGFTLLRKQFVPISITFGLDTFYLCFLPRLVAHVCVWGRAGEPGRVMQHFIVAFYFKTQLPLCPCTTSMCWFLFLFNESEVHPVHLAVNFL